MRDEPDGGDPAFGRMARVGDVTVTDGGLTVRDWLAAHAPDATNETVERAIIYLDQRDQRDGKRPMPRHLAADEAHAYLRYVYADAMLRARRRRTE